MVSNAQDILRAAADAIDDRAAFRDSDGEKSMRRTVEVFNQRTGNTLSIRDGWMFMGEVKLGRAAQGRFHLDDWIDGVAFFALAGEEASREAMPRRPEF